jgi:hypothetical protein
MKDIILSMPEFYLYLVFVVPLLITALWRRETGSPVGEPRAAAALWSSALPLQHDRRPFRDLQATLSASYAARLEQVIRTIRVDSPLERGQTIKRPGEWKAPAAEED